MLFLRMLVPLRHFPLHLTLHILIQKPRWVTYQYYEAPEHPQMDIDNDFE